MSQKLLVIVFLLSLIGSLCVNAAPKRVKRVISCEFDCGHGLGLCQISPLQIPRETCNEEYDKCMDECRGF
ncbi:hypothetical protein Bhyg_02447 [Pseudolycoriella hygida]|uniref:Uncharacterized protein n=1 Tax=Pseudolycoriella hygida TaxID=35572 RepID=A0A9Q0NCN9_9DIPT|nr:hypothetical protein Bhyg_02447 [Pseudolycoriella hygida]